MKTKTKQKPRFFKQAEFYMRRGNRTYFRNKGGKYIIENDDLIFLSLKYGKKYDSVLYHLVDTKGEILVKREWD